MAGTVKVRVNMDSVLFFARRQEVEGFTFFKKTQAIADLLTYCESFLASCEGIVISMVNNLSRWNSVAEEIITRCP